MAKQPRITKFERVEFGIFSPEEILNMSVLKESGGILHTELYDENKHPKVNGLCDPRLGCVDKNQRCATCEETISSCPGHFGHLQLETPVYHVGFIRVVKKILECVCYKCARFRFVPENKESMARWKKLKKIKNKFSYAWDICKGKRVCPYPDCEHPLLPLRKTGINIYKEPGRIDKNAKRTMLYADEAREILSRISDETCRLIGLNPETSRPEWMILTVLPIPPPCIRPSVQMDAIGKGEDDLTYMLINIVRCNQSLKKEGINSRNFNITKEQLQIHVTTYIDNDVSGVPPAIQKGGRPIKSITARLKGKEGRIRGNLMGKRVNFCARTVITGDPNLSIDEIGVPKSIAKRLTFPENVTDFNIEKLQQLVYNGKNYPGARMIVREDGSRYNLELPEKIPLLKIGDTLETISDVHRCIEVNDVNIGDLQTMINGFVKGENIRYVIKNGDKIKFQIPRKPLKIKVGDVVERHIVDGDTVLFNRQPTLHKMSMMAHRVKVMEFSTFRMNVCITSSYNADFDGDEMNIHMPQSYEALGELKNLAMVDDMLVSSQANKPVNSLVQDSLFGIRKFTKRDVFLDYAEVCQLILYMSDFDGVIPPPAIYRPKKLWTGKQIISMILPEIDFEGTHSTHTMYRDLYKDAVEFDKTNPYDTKVLIENGELLSGIICKKSAGSSAGGIIHIIYNDMGSKAAMDFMNNASQIVNQWLLSQGFSVGIGDGVVNEGISKKIKGIIDTQYFEAEKISSDYKKGLLKPQGNLTVEETKECQIQNLLSKARDKSGKLSNELLHKDNNLKQMSEAGSKGSILNICQITACLGQQIVDGKRIPNGFRDRSLPYYPKNFESPESKGFIRNSFLTGLNPEEVFFHAMGGREGIIDTACKTAETGYIQRRLIKGLEDISIQYDGTVRDNNGTIFQFLYGEDGFDGVAIEYQTFESMLIDITSFKKKYYNECIPDEYLQLLKDREYLRKNLVNLDDKCLLPLNIKRIIKYGQRKVSTNIQLDPHYIYKKINELRQKLRPYSCLKTIYKKYNPSELFSILFTSMLSSNQVLFKYKLNKDQFDWILSEIERKYFKGLVQPGESVGIIAAQSIGEPATQMTLNSVEYNTEIALDINNNQIIRTRIGEFIDKYLLNNTKHLQFYGSDGVRESGEYVVCKTTGRTIKNEIIYCTVSEKIQIPSCDENGKISWKKIIAVTRHPVVNDDGSATLLKITLKSGRTITATKGESFLMNQNNKILPIRGDLLKIGDFLPVTKNIMYATNQQFIDLSKYLPKYQLQTELLNNNIILDYNFGWFCGAYLAKGKFTKNQIIITNHDDDFNKKVLKIISKWNLSYHITHKLYRSKNIIIHPFIFTTLFIKLFGIGHKRIAMDLMCGSIELKKGLIEGYFDGAGNVSKRSGLVSVSSKSKKLLEDYTILLSEFDIRCKLTYTSTIWINAFQLSLSVRYSIKFAECFNLTIKSKKSNLQKHFSKKIFENSNILQSSQDIFYDEIIKIEEIVSAYPYVYDFTVEDTKNFSVYNGIACRDTFHTSGSGNKTVTTGIPRLKELINAAKTLKTPGMTIYLREPYASDYTQAYLIKTKIEYTSLWDIVDSKKVEIDPDYTNTTISEDRYWLKIINEIPDSDMPNPNTFYESMLRIVFSRHKMSLRFLTMTLIKEKLYENYGNDIFILHSDDNDDALVMHIRIKKIEMDDDNVELLNNHDFLEYYSFDMLSSICICGIPGLFKTFIADKNITVLDSETNQYVQKKIYTIETDGINIAETILIPEIDPYQLSCNNPQSMLSFFGIELARDTLLYEIRSIIEGGGSSINYRHLGLLCDVMTNRGQIISMTRHGINRTDVGTLMKMTFEQSVDIIFAAAVNGDVDNLKGISENILTGKLVKCGTGAIDLLIDPVCVKNMPKRKDNLLKSKIVENVVSYDTVVEPNFSTYNPMKPSYMKS